MTLTAQRRRIRLLSGAAFISLIAGLAGSAYAADTPADQTDQTKTVSEVVVTGIRGGIERSIAIKKQSPLIVESVTAEEIGKLPDVSIAESLARLPGLTAQRLDGRAQLISIRGLGPDFTTALLNGREQVSTGDNRGVEFDQFPSELLAAALVYKTPDASLIGQGLAGTVDLQTIRPLEYGHRAINIGARGEWDSLGALNAGTKASGDRVNASFIDQFDDGKFGVMLGFAHTDSPYQANRFNAWGYPTCGNADPQCGGAPAGTLVLGGAKPFNMSADLVRDAVVGTAEFRPNDRVTSTLDAFYSTFKNTQILRGIEMPLYWGGVALAPGATVQNGMITAGTWEGVKGVVRNDENKRDARITSVGWNTKANFDDGWSATLDLSYSDVHRVDDLLETYAGTGRAGRGATDILGMRMLGGTGVMFSPSLNYADYNTILLTSPQGWGGPNPVPGGQDGYLNQPTTNDRIEAVRASARKDFSGGPFKSVEFGGNYQERKKTYVADEWFLQLKASPASVPVPTQFREGSTSLGFIGIPGMISYDPIGLLNSGIYNLIRNPNGDVIIKSWEVDERVALAYVQGNIDTHVGEVPLTGNVGLQYVYTDQSSTATAVANTGPNPPRANASGGAKYGEVLPSLNLSFHVAEDMQLRFAAARELARARMDQMSAANQFSFNPALWNATQQQVLAGNGPWSSNGGNPALKPYIADAVDLSLEKYFGSKGYVSVAAFYKHLESFVFNGATVRDFTGYPYTLNPGTGPLTNFTGLNYSPVDLTGGYIEGVEFSLSTPFEMFHPALKGFGFEGSASFTDSSIRPTSGSSPIEVPGLSRTVVNTTLYYTNSGFEARISDRYRTKFLGEVAGFGDSRTFRDVAPESVIDSQLSYKFSSGRLTGLNVLFQVNNLTDEPFKTFQNNDPRQVIDYQRYGRTFLFGFNWTM
jgi:iron complex outermembrane receptor protein